MPVARSSGIAQDFYGREVARYGCASASRRTDQLLAFVAKVERMPMQVRLPRVTERYIERAPQGSPFSLADPFPCSQALRKLSVFASFAHARFYGLPNLCGVQQTSPRRLSVRSVKTRRTLPLGSRVEEGGRLDVSLLPADDTDPTSGTWCGGVRCS